MTIEFPFEMGQEVFEVNGQCSSLCFRTSNENLKKDMKCEGFQSKCYTENWEPIRCKIKESNCMHIKKYWGKEFFLTEQEAEKKTIEICKRNKSFWTERGFVFNDEGVCISPDYREG